MRRLLLILLLLTAASAQAKKAVRIPDVSLPPDVARLAEQVLDAVGDRDWPRTLTALDSLERADPFLFEKNSYPYLRARALEELGRPALAVDSLRVIESGVGPLVALARERRLLIEWELGRDGAIGGLLELAKGGGDQAISASRELLESLAVSSDLQLLAYARQLEEHGPRKIRREVRLRQAEALARLGRMEQAVPRLVELAENEHASEVSLLALRELDRLGHGLSTAYPPGQLCRLAETARVHRSFALAIPALEQCLPDGAKKEYTLGLSKERFGLYDQAQVHYRRGIPLEARAKERDRLHYRLAQTSILAGRRGDAIEILADRVDAAETRWGRNHARLTLFRSRVEQGRFDQARPLLASLEKARVSSKGRSFLSKASRAELRVLLGAALIEAGRAEEALDVLSVGGSPDQAHSLILYWRSQAQSINGDDLGAARSLAAAVAGAGDDPIRWLALGDLESLAQETREEARRLAVGSLETAGKHRYRRLREVLALSSSSSERHDAVERMRSAASSSDRLSAFLDLSPVPLPSPLPGDHPKVDSDRTRHLMVLGLFGEVGPDLRRYLPVGRPDTALAAADAWARGHDWPRAVSTAESLRKQAAELPLELLPDRLVDVLYPLAFPTEVGAGARSAGVEPELIRAVMREESRFRAGVRSDASARGLMQFILPTAEDMAEKLGIGAITPSDLFQPELSVRLGAHYLAHLLEEFDGARAPAIAAYNAGERPVRTWLRSAGRSTPDLFVPAVTYNETRTYVRRVLGSYHRYRDLGDRRVPVMAHLEGVE